MDREILRELAGQVAEIAALDVQKETEKLYRGVNGLHMIRPVVMLDELPWNQLNGDGELTLLFCGEAGLADGLNAAIWVDKALEIFHIAIIEIHIWICFNLSHNFPSLEWDF